jgi:hypothetical protein
VWGGYRFVALADRKAESGLKIIDLGAGHSSASETLCGRVIGALKTEALLNESVGAGYLDRHWPPAFKDTGAWPLKSLRQSFLDGSLTRLTDPDAVLRRKIVEFVEAGSFGLASGATNGGTYERLWSAEPVGAEEVEFEASVFLLTKEKVETLRKTPEEGRPQPEPAPEPGSGATPKPEPGSAPEPDSGSKTATLRLTGTVPPEIWNRLGTKILPKLRSGDGLSVGIELSVNVDATRAAAMEAELRQILGELDLSDRVRLEYS